MEAPSGSFSPSASSQGGSPSRGGGGGGGGGSSGWDGGDQPYDSTNLHAPHLLLCFTANCPLHLPSSYCLQRTLGVLRQHQPVHAGRAGGADARQPGQGKDKQCCNCFLSEIAEIVRELCKEGEAGVWRGLQAQARGSLRKARRAALWPLVCGPRPSGRTAFVLEAQTRSSLDKASRGNAAIGFCLRLLGSYAAPSCWEGAGTRQPGQGAMQHIS